MKCLNMKIAELLFFTLNFVMIYQMDAKANKTSQMATLMSIPSSNVVNNCPELSKIIHDNNLTDYKSNCTLFEINDEITIEKVLQQACFVVNYMLDFICDKKLNATAHLFKLNDSDPICPFNFSHLERLNFRLTNFKLLNELKNKDHCLKVCSDLYSKRTLCILLSKLNYFLESFTQPTTPKESSLSEVGSPPVKFEQTKIDPEKTLERNVVKDKFEISGNKSVRASINATEIMKDRKKDKHLMMTSVPEVESKSNYKIETSKTSGIFPENNDLKSENENLNEEKISTSDNKEDISLLGDSFPDKAEIVPEMESSDVKIDSSSKQREIYSGERFFSAEDSHFFFYLIMVSSVIVIGYIAFHNKNKILAYALEGTSGRRSRRRPNPARYRKLETNLEEVISSSATNAATSSVVY